MDENEHKTTDNERLADEFCEMAFRFYSLTLKMRVGGIFIAKEFHDLQNEMQQLCDRALGRPDRLNGSYQKLQTCLSKFNERKNQE